MFFKKVFQELAEREIKYAVAGGVAVNIHGYIRNTMDLDILLYMDDANLKKFVNFVDELGFKPRVPVEINDFLVKEKREDWCANKNMKVFCVYNPKCEVEQIDILIDPELKIADILSRSIYSDIYDIKVPVVSIEDLVAMKLKVGRQRDIIDIEQLRTLGDLSNDKAQ